MSDDPNAGLMPALAGILRRRLDDDQRRRDQAGGRLARLLGTQRTGPHARKTTPDCGAERPIARPSTTKQKADPVQEDYWKKRPPKGIETV